MNLSQYKIRSLTWILKFIVITLISVMVGLLSTVMPWFISVGLFSVAAYFLAVWLYPWLGLGLHIILALFLPDFKTADVLTVSTAMVIVAKFVHEGRGVFWISDKLKKPYLLFLFLVALSTCLGLFYFHNSIPFIYRDARIFIYWLWLPIIGAMLIDGNKNTALSQLSKLLFALGFVVSLVAIVQFVTGIQFIAAGRVGALETAGVDQGNFTRVQLPGYPFVVWSLLYSVLLVVKDRISVLLFLLVASIFAFALLVNFGRGLWVWTLIGLMLTALFYRKIERVKFIVGFILISMISVTSLLAMKPDFVEAVVVRMLSVKNETAQNWGPRTSYEWRQLENKDAQISIMRSPILGVGIGGEYRHAIWELREIFEDHTRYIHNSYLFVLVKLGVFGLAVFLFFIFRAWYVGLCSYRSTPEASKPIVAASLAALPAYACLSVTQPELVTTTSVIFFVLIFCSLTLHDGADDSVCGLKQKA